MIRSNRFHMLVLALATLLSLGAPFAVGAEWPQFHGPGGAGAAPEGARPPTRIAPNTNVKWKVGVPAGASSAVISGDRLFLTCYEGGKLYTLAYSRADGSKLWRAEAPATKIEPFEKTSSSPAASTPATDGHRLVVYFGSYGLICYDMAGKQLWKYALPLAQTFCGFGSGSSPVIADGRIVLLLDQEPNGKLLCLDLKTGARTWETARDGHRTSWGSACIWETSAGKQVVVAGGLRLAGYDLKSGSEVWHVRGLPSYQCTTPLVADGKLIYAGWSPGGSPEFKKEMPSFDELLKQAGEQKRGHLTRAGAEKTVVKGYFDDVDVNKDGTITRDEWDTPQARFMSSGKNVAFALTPGGKGELTKLHVAWTVDKTMTKGLPYVSSPLVYRGLMYTVNKQGRLSAFDMKRGKAVNALGEIGLSDAYASPVAANGHLYLCGLDGSVIVLKAGNEPERVSFEELDGSIAATPAIAGNTIYIRTSKFLYAFGEK